MNTLWFDKKCFIIKSGFKGIMKSVSGSPNRHSTVITIKTNYNVSDQNVKGIFKKAYQCVDKSNTIK